MLEVSSFAMAGDADMDAEFASDAVDMRMQIGFTYEKAGEGSLAEAHITFEGNSSKNGPIAFTATGYIENEYICDDGRHKMVPYRLITFAIQRPAGIRHELWPVLARISHGACRLC